jgi:hypothetical protein
VFCALLSIFGISVVPYNILQYGLLVRSWNISVTSVTMEGFYFDEM